MLELLPCSGHPGRALLPSGEIGGLRHEQSFARCLLRLLSGSHCAQGWITDVSAVGRPCDRLPCSHSSCDLSVGWVLGQLCLIPVCCSDVPTG